MVLREERHIPTDKMLSDALTKPGLVPQLMHMPTTGKARFTNNKVVTCYRTIHIPDMFTESDPENITRY